MYWFRQTPIQFIPWLVIAAVWLLGGWLLARHAFRLERRERLVIGAGLGLVPYLWFANILGHWLSPYVTFTLSGFVVLGLGLAFAWKSERPILDWRDFQAWKLLLIGLIIVWVFGRMGKGLSLFDEHKNLSIISTMASGDIPPHFYMNSALYFPYHYGFQLFGASMMRMGGLTPWSAFDFSKALVGALSILFGFLLGRRYTQNTLGGILIAVLLLFATGTRYLLLLLPPGLLQNMDALVALQGTSAELDVPFSQSLVQPWAVDGGPPFPFPFAFLNGILSWPRIMAIQAGPSSLALAIFLLIWLLYARSQRKYSFLILLVLFSMWALAWESSYSLFVTGGILVTLFQYWNNRDLRAITPEVVAMLLSIPLVFLQGGTLTELLRQQLDGANQASPNIASTSLQEFFFRWPPAIVSSHLGSLSIFNPLELITGFFEIGPIILFTPWITLWSWRRFRQGDWFIGVLLTSSWIGFLVPIFIGFQPDRDITRFAAYGIQVWMLLLVLLVWELTERVSVTMKAVTAAGLSLMVFGGMVIAGSALTAASQAVLPFQLTALDTYVSAEMWDALPPGSEVFDPATWRSTALTGRLNRSSYTTNVFALDPEFKQLREEPTVEKLLADGYDYIYIDENWWEGYSEESKISLNSPCVKVLSEHWDRTNKQFRRLLDLTQCKP